MHADDAHLLPRAVGGEAAYVFGNSYGAMIGMDLLARVRVNLARCLEYELRSFTRFRPDLDTLRAGPLVLAVGADASGSLPYQATVALAERLGARTVAFPGDHIGYVTRPVEFAAALAPFLT